MIGAFAMTLALPKTGIALAAPVGAAGLFAAWYALEPGRASLVGFLAGLVYFCGAFAWFGETAGALVAPFGFALVLAPAGIEALAFAAAGALTSLAARRVAPAWSPAVAAAAFAACEWLRCGGPLAAPFACLGYTQLDGALAPLAADVGTFGLTFVVAASGAYLARFVRATFRRDLPRPRRRAECRAAAAFFVVLGCATALAWATWPARRAAPATTAVAAIQGNIRQRLKWSNAAFYESLFRYERLTRLAVARRPSTRIVLWPETVVTTDLDRVPWVQARLAALARETRSMIVVGTKRAPGTREYNAVYIFDERGAVAEIYDKRELVPFVETLPGDGLLRGLPGADLVSRFSAGTTLGVLPAGGIRIAPLICWESTFSEHAVADVRAGADALLVATDDAWFGTSAGPYAHAEISRMRALETGAWILRAGATGISGIISPDGRWTTRAELEQIALVHGRVGPAARTFYDALGPAPIGLALLAGALLPLVRRSRPREATA